MRFSFYNEEVKRWKQLEEAMDVNNFVNNDPSKISWTRSLKQRLKRKDNLEYNELIYALFSIVPFTKQYLYFGRSLNEMIYQQDKLWPRSISKNLMICVSGTKGFTSLISDHLVDLHYIGDTQCFPLYFYEKSDEGKYNRLRCNNR